MESTGWVDEGGGVIASYISIRNYTKHTWLPLSSFITPYVGGIKRRETAAVKTVHFQYFPSAPLFSALPSTPLF